MATLARFPAALFDAHGYVLFGDGGEYRTSPHPASASKSAFEAGISAIPVTSPLRL